MKTRIKITATLLSFVMFMLAVPMLVWKASADEITNVVEEIKTNSFSVDMDNMTKGPQEKERYILSENIENREADSKEFIMSDGTIMVQQYAGRIHYMDNGEYKEIDNSLIVTNKGYENKANSFKININKSMQSNENLVEISDDNYSISFDLINKKNVVETVTAGLNQARQVIDYKDVRVNEPQSAMTVNGVVKFPDIQNDIDIEYKVENNGLKENIIVNKKQNSYNYDFQVNVENLALELTEGGVVLAKDNNEQIQFIIPAPFMTDKNGQFSDQVEYALSENEEGYVLTVEADSQWINNNAVLPVTIDPIIYKYEEVVNNFSFVNVFNNKSPVNSGEFGYVGKKDKARCNVYIRFNVPERGKTYKLLEGNFNFYHKTGGINIFRGTNLKYSANVVSNSISMSNITYTNQPSVLQTLRDCGANVNVAPTTQQYSVDFNVGYIQNNTITFGLKFKDECSEYMYAYIYMTGEHAPFVTLMYKLSTGLDEEYSVESTEINGATAYVNNVTGNLTVNMNLASVNTMDLPFELSLVYNTEYNYILDKLNVSKMFGNNLKLNVQQYLKQFDTAYYYYYDSDGSGQVISADNNMPNQYSKNGKLKRDINGNLIDSQGNKLLFQSEKLTEIASLYNNQVGIVIDYNSSNKITNVDYITDETVFNCAFSYSGERVSSAIVYCYGKQIAKYNLYYDSRGNLTRINNSLSGNDVLILSYDSGNKLTGIFNSRQEGLGFSYNGKAISNVYKYLVASASGSVTNEELQFLFNNQLTTVTKYSNNSKTSENYISFDKDYNVLSEWSKNASGEITVFQRGNWSQISLNGMEKRSYQYEQTLNTSLKTTRNLSANQSTTISIGTDSGVENKSVKQYVVGFKVEQSSAINLSVTAGSATGSFTNSSGGTQYVILPCSYISSGSITIKNNGSGTAKISDVCFAAADYTYQKLSYDSSDIYVFYPSEITQITSTGYYTKNTYDRFGKTLTTETKNYLDTAVEKTTYTYGTTYFRPGGVSEPMISSVTTKNGSTIERIDNTYSETSVTKKRTKSGLKTRTVSTTQFNEAFKNSVTSTGTTLYRTLINVDENGVESSEQYSLTHGDIRLTSSISGDTKYVYEYNYDGDITSIKAYNGNTLLSSQTFTYTDALNTGGNYQGYTYAYERNSNSFLTSISYNSDEKITYSYDVNNYLASKTYANNQSVVCDYLTNVGLLTSLRYKVGAELAADEYKYIYDNADELTSVKKVNGNNVKVQYSYDESSDKKENTLEISGDMYYNVSATSEYDLDRNALLNTQIKFMRDGSVIKTYV